MYYRSNEMELSHHLLIRYLGLHFYSNKYMYIYILNITRFLGIHVCVYIYMYI
jgi:hypothetical protein